MPGMNFIVHGLFDVHSQNTFGQGLKMVAYVHTVSGAHVHALPITEPVFVEWDTWFTMELQLHDSGLLASKLVQRVIHLYI